MQKLLTIGFATYRDPDGIWGTITDLQAHHRHIPFDLLVVDNSPTGCVDTMKKTQAAKGRYIHRPDLTGTGAPRDALFRFARTPFVAVCDSHIAFDAGALNELQAYLEANPDSHDLLQGPLVTDDGQMVWSHWESKDPPLLLGTWHTDPRLRDGKPFPIESQGLGFFCMNKKHWPGFNHLFRGFGGEEGYIHRKVRQQGGQSLCLPGVRWWHHFREENRPAPYTARAEDEAWNLLIGHREVAVEAKEQIYKEVGHKLKPEVWQRMVEEAEAQQLAGLHDAHPKPTRVLGIWYSNNKAPESVLERSLESIKKAWMCSKNPVRVLTCSWENVKDNTLPWTGYRPQEGRSGHQHIVAQQEKLLLHGAKMFGGPPPELVVFLEHDVEYHAGHFDQIADAWRRTHQPKVVSNVNYLGVNESGYQKVVRNDHPLHQLAVRWDVAVENLKRCRTDVDAQGWCFLEPEHLDKEKKGWAYLRCPVPNLHINHGGGFTSHSKDCYEPVSSLGAKGTPMRVHPVWGDFRGHWPFEVKVEKKCGGCGTTPLQFKTADEWYQKLAGDTNSDFGAVHMAVLRSLAARCGRVGVFSVWNAKPGPLASLLASDAAQVVSVSPGHKAEYITAAALKPEGFKVYKPEEDIGEIDLLMLDPVHDTSDLWPLLEKYGKGVKKYLLFHATETFGSKGERTQLGMLPAIRMWVKSHPEWSVIHTTSDNHGMIVLSCLDEDRKEAPDVFRKAFNYGSAKIKAWRAGNPATPPDVFEQRMELCLLCEHRAHDVCTACGCPLEKKLAWATEECGLVKLGLPPKWPAVKAE